MNLLDQIDRRLGDPTFSFSRDVFERCATALLTEPYSNLVPITGGSDDGRDADISDADGTIAVLVTSARDIKGVLENLREGCRQMVAKGVPNRRLILANLAVLNASKRKQIHAAASELGFKVVEIYPRPWFAHRLRGNPEWRVSLLQLRGGVYTLSRPAGDGLGEDIAPTTVGRSVEIDTIARCPDDLIVSGEPGVGKTHLVAQLAGALFVEKLADLSTLADDLLESNPTVVVVDDAGARPGVVAELVTIRRKHHLTLRLVAVCWPHEKEIVEDQLPDAGLLSIGRMTRSELGEILRGMGITRDAVLRRILDQADGRPAWAVRLGSLLKDGSQWSDVLRGESVRQEVRKYLRNSRISVHAYDTVATVALLGGLKDTEFRDLATVQGGSVQDVNATLRKVAESGLLDATALKIPGADRVVTYTVQPDLLAASLVADAYFSNGVAPHPVAELRAAFPERQFDIVMNTIIAELVGASCPSRPTNEQVLAALGTELRDPQKNMLRYYSALGPFEANFVLKLMLEFLRAGVANLEHSEVNAYVGSAAMLRADLLAELAGDSVQRIGYEASLKHLAAGAALLVEAGEDCASCVGTYFEHVRSSDIGESVQVAELVKLSEAVGAMPTSTVTERTVFFEVASQGLAPSWEANYIAPDKPRSFTLKSFLLPSSAMADVASPILSRLEAVGGYIDNAAFGRLAKPLDTWVHAGAGYALPAGLRVADDERAAAVGVATRFATALANSALAHGSRRRLNGICKPLKLRWPDPDPLFNALAPLDDAYDVPDEGDGGDAIDYLALHEKKENEARARVVAAIAEYLDQPPAVLCGRLQELQPEIQVAELRGTDQTRAVFHHLATIDMDPVPWVQAALDHDLGWHALPLIEILLRTDTVPEPLLNQLLGGDTRAGLIGAALERGTGKSLATILNAVTESDFDRHIWTSFVRVTPEALKLLNEHADRRVAALGITCWAGWYEYVHRLNTNDDGWLEAQLAAVGDSWTDTMRSLEVPNAIDDHALERALVALAHTAPSKFSDLFIRHVEQVRYRLNDFDVWAPAAHTLPADQKTAVWERLNEHLCKREVFWAIAGTDTAWIEARLSDGSVPYPDELLGGSGFQRTERPPIEEIASLFVGKAEPERILASIVDPTIGDEVALAEQMLDQSQKLAKSDNPGVAEVGIRGVQTWVVRLAAAKKEARDAEIRGDLWS